MPTNSISNSASKIKLLFVLGTRPEAIKLVSLIALAKADPRYDVFVCSTGQHREMLSPVLSFFEIVPNMDFELMTPGQTLARIAEGTLAGLASAVAVFEPSGIVVQGDTTSAFAGALFGYYSRTPVYHIEAGLRSGDMDSPYPEEFNRRAIALAAKIHFAPTPSAAENLFRESVARDSVVVTGNTGIDTLLNVVKSLKDDSTLANRFEEQFYFLNPRKKLLLVTLHRRENFGEKIRETLQALRELSQRDDLQIVATVHLNPNVRSAFAGELSDTAVWAGAASRASSLVLCEPQDYLPFVYLMAKAHLILTDSGGIQEEAPYLGKAILVARTTTERPEALDAGNSLLLKLTQKQIIHQVNEILDTPEKYEAMSQERHVFGDGRACHKILDTIANSV